MRASSADNAIGFSQSTCLPASAARIVHGTSGRIEVQIPFNAPNDRPCRVFVDDGRELGDRSAEAIDFPAVDQYTLQGDAFSAAVRGERSVPVSVEDAIGNMAVIDAIFRSADSGRWEEPAR